MERNTYPRVVPQLLSVILGALCSNFGLAVRPNRTNVEQRRTCTPCAASAVRHQCGSCNAFSWICHTYSQPKCQKIREKYGQTRACIRRASKRLVSDVFSLLGVQLDVWCANRRFLMHVTIGVVISQIRKFITRAGYSQTGQSLVHSARFLT